MIAQHSLLDAPAGRPFDGAMDWIIGTLLGEIAVALCVIAVALVGMVMLTGRMPARRGLQVILGCFVLLGAPAIASGFAAFRQDQTALPPVAEEGVSTVVYRREELPVATEEPYARASFRRN